MAVRCALFARRYLGQTLRKSYDSARTPEHGCQAALGLISLLWGRRNTLFLPMYETTSFQAPIGVTIYTLRAAFWDTCRVDDS